MPSKAEGAWPGPFQGSKHYIRRDRGVPRQNPRGAIPIDSREPIALCKSAPQASKDVSWKRDAGLRERQGKTMGCRKESLVEAGCRSMQGVGTTDASPEKEKKGSAD